MNTENSHVLNSTDAARYIGMSPSYLSMDRCDGHVGNRTPGPPFIKVGRRVLYRVADLDGWLDSHRVSRGN